jgi:GxxExxY protein
MMDEGGKFKGLTEQVIGAAIEVHRALGPGLLESAYEACLARELTLRHVPFRRQVPLPIEYRGEHVESAYRLDFLVDDTVILEIKAVEETHPIHDAQLLTYLRLSRKPVGLMINFNTQVLRDGIRRFSL